MSIGHRSVLLGAVSSICFGLASASAQEGVTYQAFTGMMFVMDNPTSAACQAVGINFASAYTTIYRISMNPAVIADALAIHSTRSEAQMYSTQAPNFSLQGASTTGWNHINRYGSFGTLNGSSSNLVLRAGLTGLPAAPGNANVILNGSINDFFAVSGCNVTVHGALARNPD